MKEMFYKSGVDISSVKSMWNFLHEHFTYPTMNSWNGQTSIAHNVKLYNLKLEGDWTVAMRFLFDEGDSGALQMAIDDQLREFESNNPGYRVGFNGRQGGYLVLYNKDNFKTVLPDCLDYDSYEDFKTEVRWDGYTIEDYKEELRQAVTIVREFDKLCDRLREEVNWYSTMNFNVVKMNDAIERFNITYGDDFDSLGLEGPTMTEGSDFVELNACAHYLMFLECFLNCFGEDRRRTYLKDGRLYMKED
jgi:hypothetical protein